VETRELDNGVKVVRYQIGGTNNFMYAAYEPYIQNGKGGSHSCTLTINGKWFGKVGTLRPSPELDALPGMSPERMEAVTGHYGNERRKAYRYIREAYPDIAGRMSCGDIMTVE